MGIKRTNYLMDLLSSEDLEQSNGKSYLRLNRKDEVELFINSYNPGYNASIRLHDNYKNFRIYELRLNKKIKREDFNEMRSRLLSEYEVLIGRPRFVLIQGEELIENLLKELKVIK